MLCTPSITRTLFQNLYRRRCINDPDRTGDSVFGVFNRYVFLVLYVILQNFVSSPYRSLANFPTRGFAGARVRVCWVL